MRIRRRIEATMRGAGRGRSGPIEILLYLLSLVYGAVVRLRGFAYSRGIFRVKRLPCAVVSIGNLAVGGTGKTPMAVYAAQRIRDLGYTVVVLSRGYRGKAEAAGGVVSDGESVFMTPDDAGDEPCMMAGRLKAIPVLVGKDRFAQGTEAIRRFHPQVIVLDDGFQHLALDRDLDLVLLDSRHPAGNGYLLPRGSLREPLAALGRSDGIILTRRGDAPASRETASPSSGCAWGVFTAGKPMFRSYHVPCIRRTVAAASAKGRGDQTSCLGADVRGLDQRAAFAFSGVADNAGFRETLSDMGCRLKGFLDFPDHHTYMPEDLSEVHGLAMASGADLITTTEKDFVRIPDSVSWPMDLVVLGLDVSFGTEGDGENAFDAYLQQRLRSVAGP